MRRIRDATRAAAQTAAERSNSQERIRGGETFARAAAAVGCSTKSIQRLLGGAGVPEAAAQASALLRLSLAEREEIRVGPVRWSPVARSP